MRIATIFAVVLGLLAVPAQAVVINGSFEHGRWVPNGSARLITTTGITGWTLKSNDVDYFTNGFFGLQAQHGNRAVDLSGNDDGFGTLAQSLNTTAGMSYVLKFWLGGSNLFGRYGEGGAGPKVNVNLGGTVKTFTGSRNAANDWQMQSWMFTASSNTTYLSFTGLQDTKCCYIGLDNVSVRAVAEPGSLGMLFLGLLGLGLVRRTARS